jgi:hypothetical protein
VNGSATANPAGSGNRTDEGCYDPDDHIMMFTNNADVPPFSTFINTDTNTVIAQLVFPASAVGGEACDYDHNTKSFFVNDVGSDTATPSVSGSSTNAVGGGLIQILASTVVAKAPAIQTEYSETFQGVGCNPTGLADNHNGQLEVGCGDVSGAANAFPTSDPGYATAVQLYGTGKPLHSLIMNAADGSLVAFVPYGGSDEVWYDAKKNRYYDAARFWTTSGLAGGTAQTTIGVIDASNGAVLGTLPTIGAVHSVAADPLTGNVFFPHQPNATAPGGIDVYLAH